MKNHIKLILVILAVIFNLGLVYSAVCCYTPGSDTNIVFRSSCLGNQVQVGVPDLSSITGTDLCKEFNDQRLGCYDAAGRCNPTPMGNRIFDIPVIAQALDWGSNYGKYCASVSPYTSACISGSGWRAPTDVIGGGGDISDPNVIGRPIDLPDEITLNRTVDIEDERKFCSNAGDPFGFFVSKNSCEALENCIYNPNLGGKFSVKFQNADILKISEFESACIPKIQVWECFDYKTEENCVSNPSLGVSSSNLLEDGCRWISAEEYNAAGFTKSGICISNSVNLEKDFNKNAYSFRMNLIENPDFEMDSYGWGGNINIVSNITPVSGSKAAYLNSGESISQNISNVAPRISFKFFLYANPGGSFGVDDYIRYTIVPSSGEDFSAVVYLSDVFSFNTSSHFEKIVFPSFIVPANANDLRLIISYEGESSIYVDAFNFEPESRDVVTTSDLIFKPVSIPVKEASKCQFCFDPFNLNYCTAQKSDYLGDCSYMVPNMMTPYNFDAVSDYLGTNDNPYINLDIDMWKHQSMANSQIFCELYMTREICTNPDNYVNSVFSRFHQTPGNLCKWSDTYGCYKDSDGTGYPDTRMGFVYTNFLALERPDFANSIINGFSNYVRDSDVETGIISDFAYGCDILPPTSYAYFTGYNLSGELISITEASGLIHVGMPNFNLYVSDAHLQSCDPFNIPKKIYVDYTINGQSSAKVYETNQIYLREIPMRDFFVDMYTEEPIFEEGINEVHIEVKDQSGNVERTISFSLEADLSGPLIEMVDPQTETGEAVNMILGPNNILSFEISDYSGVNSCSYILTPITTGVPASFYNSSGNWSISSGETNINYDFSLPIFNTTNQIDLYLLSIECLDVFGIAGEAEYILLVDFNTDIIVIEPLPFTNYKGNTGFLNSPTLFWGASTDRTLESCTLEFDTYDGGELNINLIEEGFSIPRYSDTFYNNVTGVVSFSSDGRKEGKIVCWDAVGNEVSKNLTYYYDTVLPELTDYTFIGRNIVNVDGKYYTIGRIDSVNLSIDGTGSWIDPSSISVAIDNGVNLSILNSARFSTLLNNESFIAQVIGRNFELERIPSDIYAGNPTSENGLVEVKYLLNFSDKAGNSNTGVFSYYHDSSTPRFIFSGDIESQRESSIYTKVSNPNIRVEFNTSSYRTFTCRVSASKSGTQLNVRKDFPEGSALNFRLSEISGQIDLAGTHNNLRLSFDCVDIYGIPLVGSYTLIYDNTVPRLNDFFLDNGNKKYYSSFEGSVYGDTVDRLVFDLADTGEAGYTCRYQFIDQSGVYDCSNEWFETDIPAGSGHMRTDNIVLVSGTDLNPHAVCSRNDRFESVKNSQSVNGTFETEIKVSGYCVDMVNLETEKLDFILKINYVSDELLSFEFDYKGQLAYPTVRSQSAFNSGITLRYEDPIDGMIMAVLDRYSVIDGLYVYTYPQGIDLTVYPEGENLAWAIAYDDFGNELDKISATFIVDKTAPTVNLNIPDEVEGAVYDDFEIIMRAEDDRQIDRIELYLGNTLIYNSENLSVYSQNHLAPIDTSFNSCSGTVCTGRVTFINTVIGQTYAFTLKAYDKSGNMNSTSITVERKDGIIIFLEDSQNAMVDPSKRMWITKETSPVINFRTNKVVDWCSLYPMILNEEWNDILGSPSASFASKRIDNTDSFSFNLQEFSGLDFSKISNRLNDMRIVCLHNNTIYNFTRGVYYIDFLPDYVLESSEGFVLTDSPYRTELRITSVGPYKYINCEYKIGSGQWTSFPQRDAMRFVDVADFSPYSGTQNLNLRCADILGTQGPEKTYIFEVDKSQQVVISNLVLLKDSKTYELDSGTIYVFDSAGYTLSTRVSKRDVSCTYQINAGSSWGIVNFFRNLFAIGRTDMDPVSPYEFTASGLSFRDGFNELKVNCGNGEKTVTVHVADHLVGVDMTRQAIN